MMASSNPLRPQNRTLQNQTGILKQQEVNKLTAVASSKRGSENLDPKSSAEAGKGVNKLKGVSRLPVLAKSLQSSGSDLSQQNRWEQRPLTGKAQKKRICTKPVPFNLSKSRTQRNTDVAGGKTPLTPSARLTPGAKQKSHKATSPGVFRSANKSQSAVPRTVGHMEHKTSTKPTSIDSTDGHPTITVSHESRSCSQTDLSSRLGSITLVQSKVPDDSGLSHFCKDSHKNNVGVGMDGQAPKDTNCIQTFQSASGTQSHAGTKAAMHKVLSCEGSNTVGAQSVMPRLSTCPSVPGSSNNLPQRVSVKKSQRDVVNTTGNAGAFSPDPSALRSILLNDAMRVVERFGATPRTSTCPTGRPTSMYSAQRVPVKKPQTDDVAAVTGSSVAFSPDPSALRSILLNEGVKLGPLVGATPRVSTCPTGRGTSIYSAQRVPLKKTKTEATDTASYFANRTPVKTWTPQRVANTKPQSMMKILTVQKMSRFRDSPGFRPQDPSTEHLIHQEDVVQRLFDDPDQLDENGVTSHQLRTTSTSHQTIEPLINKEILKSNHRHNEDEGKKTGQPFIQAAHRGSVIVFSSSQRLCGSDRPPEAAVIEKSSISHITLQSNQSNGSQVTSSSDVTKQINTCTQSQLKASALRRRHTRLEEMILDDECANYASCLLSCPLQPRCGNPVATTLMFHDSTWFLPIGLSSPIQLSPPSGSSIRA